MKCNIKSTCDTWSICWWTTKFPIDQINTLVLSWYSRSAFGHHVMRVINGSNKQRSTISIYSVHFRLVDIPLETVLEQQYQAHNIQTGYNSVPRYETKLMQCEKAYTYCLKIQVYTTAPLRLEGLADKWSVDIIYTFNAWANSGLSMSCDIGDLYHYSLIHCLETNRSQHR